MVSKQTGPGSPKPRKRSPSPKKANAPAQANKKATAKDKINDMLDDIRNRKSDRQHRVLDCQAVSTGTRYVVVTASQNTGPKRIRNYIGPGGAPKKPRATKTAEDKAQTKTVMLKPVDELPKPAVDGKKTPTKRKYVRKTSPKSKVDGTVALVKRKRSPSPAAKRKRSPSPSAKRKRSPSPAAKRKRSPSKVVATTHKSRSRTPVRRRSTSPKEPTLPISDHVNERVSDFMKIINEVNNTKDPQQLRRLSTTSTESSSSSSSSSSDDDDDTSTSSSSTESDSQAVQRFRPKIERPYLSDYESDGPWAHSSKQFTPAFFNTVPRTPSPTPRPNHDYYNW